MTSSSSSRPRERPLLARPWKPNILPVMIHAGNLVLLWTALTGLSALEARFASDEPSCGGISVDIQALDAETHRYQERVERSTDIWETTYTVRRGCCVALRRRILQRLDLRGQPLPQPRLVSDERLFRQAGDDPAFVAHQQRVDALRAQALARQAAQPRSRPLPGP